MYIHLLFDFWKLRIFQCFPFPEHSGTPTFLISRNSGLRHFLLLVICSCISHFTCDSSISPCFIYCSHLCTQVYFSVPGTTMFHSLVYNHLYSVARRSELRLLLLCSPSHSSLLLEILKISLSLSYLFPLLVTCFQIWKFWSPEFPHSLALGNMGSLRDSTGNRAIP